MSLSVKPASQAITKSPQLSSSPVGGKSFEQIRNALSASESGGTLGVPQELQKIGERLMQGKTVSPGDLLVAQIQTQALHLRVEIVSRLAEGVTSTVKRIQSQS